MLNLKICLESLSTVSIFTIFDVLAALQSQGCSKATIACGVRADVPAITGQAHVQDHISQHSLC